MQPVRSLIEAGIPLAIGSDGPMNPFLNVMLATLHPYNPKEAITREQAVRAYTYGSAFAEFAEREKGTIAENMLADLAVLSQDIFAARPPDLPNTKSLLTIIGGKIVYDALRTPQLAGGRDFASRTSASNPGSPRSGFKSSSSAICINSLGLRPVSIAWRR